MKYFTEWIAPSLKQISWRSDDKPLDFIEAAIRIKEIANTDVHKLYYRMVSEDGTIMVAMYLHDASQKRIFIHLPGRIDLQPVTLETLNTHLYLG